MVLQSYKPYSRIVTVISGLIIIIAGLDATQVISLFPEYASQINTILMIAGIIAPAISQELRVGRAEELVKEDMSSEASPEDNIQIVVNVDGTEDMLELDEEIPSDDAEVEDGDEGDSDVA